MALKWKVVSQRSWLKGLQATFSRFSQPQAVIVRLSNLLYDIRGGMRQTDGSQIITQLEFANPNGGPILEVALYSPSGVDPYYVTVQKGNAGTNQIQQPVANPLVFVDVPGGLLGTAIASGQVFEYFVTAADGQGGETTNLLPATGSGRPQNNAITISWTAVPGAVGYNVYGRIAGSIGQLNQDGASFADLVREHFVHPISRRHDLPQHSSHYEHHPDRPGLPGGDTTYNQVLGVFPSYFSPPLGYVPGATRPPTNSPHGATANGGIAGATGPLPQIVQFVNKLAFALGNGYPPQEYLDISSGGTGDTKPIGNVFNAQYPDWQASVAWNQGDIIHDSVSGGLFKAQSTGVSGATRPTFNNTLNAITTELSPGTLTWICTATSVARTPLRGAAHALVYAGSLWLANTSPTTTADQLDGPCCLKMSDVNNMESWNPVNVAFLDRDDGDEVTGLAKYTIAEIGDRAHGEPWWSSKILERTRSRASSGPATSAFRTRRPTWAAWPLALSHSFPVSGSMRLTHLGFSYFQGVSDKLVSGGGPPVPVRRTAYDIAPIDWNFVYLSKGAQSASPPMYIAACPLVLPVLQECSSPATPRVRRSSRSTSASSSSTSTT